MKTSFIHLNLHSEYSVTAGTISVPRLLARCNQLSYPAVAVTDLNNLFASIKFYQQAIANGIKPILGSEITVHFDQENYQVILLVKNIVGYHNLLKITSSIHINNPRKSIDHRFLAEHAEGLIVLSGGLKGVFKKIVIDDHQRWVQKQLAFWQQYFKENFYLEITRIGLPKEELFIQKMVQLAEHYQLPLVATNAVYYLEEEDYEAHEIKVCITNSYLLNDKERPRFQNTQYLKTPEEIAFLFSDLPESLANSVEIAKRCNLFLELDTLHLPTFSLPNQESSESYLERLSKEGLQQRLNQFNPDKQAKLNLEAYWNRLDYELRTIKQMGFASYFLIVADFIIWSQQHQIPVGPGRGSGAGSLVAYAMNITNLDPLEYDLLFERFLNPERVSMPDFDIDFCIEGRDRVIEYVNHKYGKEKVAQIATYGTMAAKAVIRDVGRVLGYPYGFVDQIAKLVPFTLGITLEQALDSEELLRKKYETEEEVRLLIDHAKKLEGLVRNLGKHAGGVVIAPSDLINFTALYAEDLHSNAIITQLDKDDIASVGLVKFDFLGLTTLTVIKWTIQAINQNLAKENLPLLDIETIPLEDNATYQLLQTGKTTAIFQLESRIAKEVIKKFKPNCFRDMIALVAIIRPGVLQSGMLDEILERKAGHAKVVYLHPALEDILRETYGVAIYQEQVMQMAQTLAGYSLGEADLLRRAMGKKKMVEMEKHRAIFIARAANNGISTTLADDIFNYMAKFASYGFNKSHSAAYGLIAYQTAWLKTHFPAEFMAAILSSEMTNQDKLVLTLNETKKLNLKLLPPDVQSSEYHFKALDSKTILYGLGALKGVGEGAAESLVATRNQQPFVDLKDFFTRLDWNKVNRRFIEALVYAGALDKLFNEERSVLLGNLDFLIQYAQNYAKQRSSGQLSLWQNHHEEPLTLQPFAPWTESARLNYEREILGYYFSGHPIDAYLRELKQCTTLNWREAKEDKIKIAGFLRGVKVLNTRSGKKMGVINLETYQGDLNITLFTECFNLNRTKLNKNQLLVFYGSLTHDEISGELRGRAENIYTLPELRELTAKRLVLQFQQFDLAISEDLIRVFKGQPEGRIKITLQFPSEGSLAKLTLAKRYQIDDHLLEQLKLFSLQLTFEY